MKRIKLLLTYDGTDFCGWQKQKEHAFGPELPSLQETLEKALKKIFCHDIDLSASGRTDAGVHAFGQVAHFDTDRNLPKDLCWALRASLPSTIVAKKAWIAPDEFHSTLSAVKKTYRYWIWNSPRPTAILARYTWWIRQRLDLDFLNEASKYLESNQDFASFRSVGTPVKHTMREIYSAKWTRVRPNLVQFEVTGNGFMKQMVRNIVGTLIEMKLKDQPVHKMRLILDAKDRKKAGRTAPPQGLYLSQVYYPQDLDKRCRQI